MAKPFIKWAGGKTQLLPDLRANMPSEIARYIEPMVGGGALFFDTAPSSALLCDLNAELVNLYTQIKTNVEAVISIVQEFEQTQESYYGLRGADRNEDFLEWSPSRLAARTLILNKLCYNGLYRVNASGFFNVPFGKRTNVGFDFSALRRCSEILATAEIRCCSYADTLSSINTGDFVYLDPPYMPISETASFTQYNRGGFGWNDHLELKQYCDRLHERGARFLLSNSYSQRIVELYAEYHQQVVLANRTINSKITKRGKVPELLIKNF